MQQLMRMDEPLEPSRIAYPHQCFADAGFRHPGLACVRTWRRHVVPAGGVATRAALARERMDRQTLTRGCRQMMGRNEDR